MSVGMVRRWLGLAPYEPTWQAMRAFTENRQFDSSDEIWFLEHSPVFTLGQSGRTEHLLAPGDIPVVRTDRGGQVTYHGPGQLVVYLLLDLRRLGMGIRRLVASLEASVIALVEERGIPAERIQGAPGVYVNGRKLAALGIRVRKQGCYHGLALNVDMDLAPFSRIDPCGHPGRKVTQLRDLGIPWSVTETGQRLSGFLEAEYGITPPVRCHRTG